MSRLNDPQFWNQYKSFLLKTTSKDTTDDRLQYAKKYYNLLTNGNAEELLSMSNEKRLHIMKALAKLSKYLGQYQSWQQIKDRYQLKYSQEDSLTIFNKIMDSETNYPAMMGWIKTTINTLPEEYGNILKFCSLTGLRPTESCESIRLIKKDCANYLNKKLMILEHFKYPEIFIRRTKKEYLSIVSPFIIKLAYESKIVKYEELNSVVSKYGIIMNMAFCRKVFATYLRMNGIEPEIIDLLQGRVPRGIFVKHYYRPEIIGSKGDIIIKLLYKLHNTLREN